MREELALLQWTHRNGCRSAQDMSFLVDGAMLELDHAHHELAAMREAQTLLEALATNVDVDGRATLALTVSLVSSIEPSRTEKLAAHTRHLRTARLRMLGPVN